MTKRTDSEATSPSGGLTNDCDGVLDRARHLVESGNDWCRTSQLSDRENYLNGKIQFRFEYVPNHTERVSKPPYHVPSVHAHCAALEDGREVRNLLSKHSAIDTFVVTYWGEKPMLLRDIELVDQIEKLIPSRFSVWLERDECVEKSTTDLVGQSILYGFCKPCPRGGKGELNRLLLARPGSEGGYNIPISMVERRPKVLDGFADQQSAFINNGFVAFSERGAVAGAMIGFENVLEGALFAENVVKLRDAFRCPTEFELR
jgi:hypothetical protein